MKIIERKTIYRDEEYLAFPNVTWINDDILACFFRHAKDRRKEFGTHTHIDPTAKIVFVTSQDGGKSFSNQINLVLDDDMSAQDPCVKVLSDGRILVNYFRWAFAPEGKGAETWGKELFERYGRTREGYYDTFNIGFSVSISDDEGKTWRHGSVIQPKGFLLGSAVRGNIVEMPDKSLLMPFYGVTECGFMASCGLVRSMNRGESWDFFSNTTELNPDKNYLEPFLYRTEKGKLISLFRTQSDFLKQGVKFEDTYLNLHISESDDDGRTFSPTREISSVWGSNPFHVLRLRSGKAFVSYGYRRAPFGIRAKLCDGELTDLNEAPEIIVRDDAPSGDLGYTCAVQLQDDSILLAYYVSDSDGTRLIEGTILKE